MSTHKNIEKICVVAIICALLITLFFRIYGDSFTDIVSNVEYEERLFDTDRVHTIDIVMDDWDSFIENCENEEYVNCKSLLIMKHIKMLVFEQKEILL